MDYAKINDLCDGIGYCQIFDACGCKIPLSKLNYAPSSKKERISNFKILSRSLRKSNVAHDIPIDKLAGSNFQANCEFLQFSYDYLHKTYPSANQTYNAYERRREAIMKQEGIGDGDIDSVNWKLPADISPGSLKERTLLRSKQKNLKRQTQDFKKSGIRPPKTYASSSSSKNSEIGRSGNATKNTIFELDLANSIDDSTDQNITLSQVTAPVPHGSPPPPPPPAVSPPKLSIPILSSPSPQSGSEAQTNIDDETINLAVNKTASSTSEKDEMTPKEVEELEQMDELIKQLEHQVTFELMGQRRLEDMVESVRIERDFYHDTLQAIEKAILRKCRDNPELLKGETANQLIGILRS